MRNADDRAKAVVEKLSALTERLKIVTEIELNVQTHETYTPSKSRQSKSRLLPPQRSSTKAKPRGSAKSKTPATREETEKLPSGFGQLLDDMLVSGSISADEYALVSETISRFPRSQTQAFSRRKSRGWRSAPSRRSENKSNIIFNANADSASREARLLLLVR